MRYHLMTPVLQFEPHILLPMHARKLLADAAKIESSDFAGCSKRRTARIDELILEFRNLYPEAFWPLDEFGFAIRE